MSKKLNVEVLEVKSVGKKYNQIWKDLFNVRIRVDGIELDFDTDLKRGLINEVKDIFEEENYNYNSFDWQYSREPKIKEIGFGG